MPISVLLVDDHELIRQGLRRAFEADPDFTVVGEARSVAESLSQAEALKPQVVVMDVNLPDGSGLDAAKRLRASYPDLGIVVLTMYADDEHLFKSLEARASAFVPKSATTDEVMAAARHAAAAPNAFSAEGLATAMRRRMEPENPPLSPREAEVLKLLSQGMTVPAIAKQLYISESTAKTHVSKLYEKLGAANRSQALLTAIRLKLIDSPT